MKVVDVFGHFPEIYKVSPTPHLEFFQYAIEGDRMYVNHTVDSLIYVYQLPDKPLYTIGYECKDIDRDYTVSRKIDNSTLFEKDLQHVGFNTGLRFIPGSDVLCRTYIKSYCCPLKVSEQRDIHPQCCCNGIADDFSEGKPLS